MLDDGRECSDVVTQISAATKALEQTGFKLVSAGLTYCLAHPEEAEAAGYPLEVRREDVHEAGVRLGRPFVRPREYPRGI